MIGNRMYYYFGVFCSFVLFCFCSLNGVIFFCTRHGTLVSIIAALAMAPCPSNPDTLSQFILSSDRQISV